MNLFVLYVEKDDEQYKYIVAGESAKKALDAVIEYITYADCIMVFELAQVKINDCIILVDSIK